MKVSTSIALPYPKIREYEKFFYILALLASLFLMSCEKDDEQKPVNNPGKGVVRQVGTPQGTAVTKEIGTEGGNIASEDGSISIEIPAGALSEKKTISIQSITSTNPSGKKTFRIMPHGNIFKKDVKITFAYTGQDVSRSIPEGLGIAF